MRWKKPLLRLHKPYPDFAYWTKPGAAEMHLPSPRSGRVIPSICKFNPLRRVNRLNPRRPKPPGSSCCVAPSKPPYTPHFPKRRGIAAFRNDVLDRPRRRAYRPRKGNRRSRETARRSEEKARHPQEESRPAPADRDCRPCQVAKPSGHGGLGRRSLVRLQRRAARGRTGRHHPLDAKRQGI